MTVRHQSNTELITVTIASGGTTSGAVYLGGLKIRAVLFPATFTGATITFTANNGSGTYKAVNGVSVSKSADEWVGVTEANALTIGNDFKVVSASTEGADRTLIIRASA